MLIKNIVKDNTVSFLRYRKGIAYYAICVPHEGDFFFPVPLDDVADATLEREDKAILYMRYIKRALDEGSFVSRSEQPN